MSKRTEIVKRNEILPERRRAMIAAVPLVDIYENDDEILLYADMPGVNKKDIDLNIDNGRLDLSGVRKVEGTGVASWDEFGDVEYRRSFSVPQTIDLGKVNAELKEGVLRLHLPKSEAAKPRRIEIKAS